MALSASNEVVPNIEFKGFHQIVMSDGMFEISACKGNAES